MKTAAEVAKKIPRAVARRDEHNDCNECNGAGSFAPVYFGEREAPDGRERLRCEGCDGTGREAES